MQCLMFFDINSDNCTNDDDDDVGGDDDDDDNGDDDDNDDGDDDGDDDDGDDDDDDNGDDDDAKPVIYILTWCHVAFRFLWCCFERLIDER